MDADEAYREKARRVLCKKATSYIKHILEATSNKTAALQPTYLPSLKSSKKGGPDMLDTVREVRTDA